jgi:hypothetical protein
VGIGLARRPGGRRGYGDCKDKATLFITFLARLGIEAHPVLLAAGGKVERDLPTIAQFNHAIAAVERPGGRLFVDLTAAGVPWGASRAGPGICARGPSRRTAEETILPERDGTADGTAESGERRYRGLCHLRAELSHRRRRRCITVW